MYRVWILLFLFGLTQPWAAAAQPVSLRPELDTMAERVQACVLCHGKEGRATNDGYYPRIAGKPAGYLYAQLTHFRDGRRRNATMSTLIDTLSDAYLREIAEYFAALDLPYPPPPTSPTPSAANTAEQARGETLVMHGDAERRIPACVQCHGSAMTGVAPAVPGLLGLPKDYLLAQLGAWRTGERRAAAPDCMAELARRLSPEDLSAVAGWLAARPVPADAKPAARATATLPLECGSAPP